MQQERSHQPVRFNRYLRHGDYVSTDYFSDAGRAMDRVGVCVSVLVSGRQLFELIDL